MKFGQLIECNVRNIYFKKHAENKAGRLVPDLFLFFKKALYKVKTKSWHPSFNLYFGRPPLGHKTKTRKATDFKSLRINC